MDDEEAGVNANYENPPNGADPRFALQIGRGTSLQSVDEEALRPIVVVLGMHRSGTSLLSHMLHLLGVDMADTSDNVSPKNPGGFWERPEIVAIHDEILAAIGRPIGRAAHVLPFPPAWWRRKEVQALKPKLLDCVGQHLARSSAPWGFKDPRTCRLLPLWWEVFRELKLKPIYVHALRSPAESSVSMSQQLVKGTLRKIGVTDGELMWLSYNYDIARYVTLKHPAILVKYDDWFSNGVAVARLLADELGIGYDLSDEDFVECVTSTVKREYRNQTGGDSQPHHMPVTANLYKALTASNPLNDRDLHALRGQLRLIDLLFKSLQPLAHDLDQEAMRVSELRTETEQQSQHIAALEQERATLVARVAEMEARIEAGGAVEAQLRAEIDELKQEREKRQAQIDNLTEEREKRQAQIDKLTEERNHTLNQLSNVQESLGAAQKLAAESRDLALKRASELEAATLKSKALEAELSRVETELEATTLKSKALEAELSRVETELEATTLKSEAMGADLAEARRIAARLRRRTHMLIAKAREWRTNYSLGGGEEGATVKSAATIAELRRQLEASERRIHEAEQTIRGLVAEVEARDSALALAQADISESTTARQFEEPVFAWPEGAFDPSTLDGQVERVDDYAIVGHVSSPEPSNFVPAVELRSDGKLLFAQLCEVSPQASDASETRWSFALPWAHVDPAHAGRTAKVLIAGVERELGCVEVPAHLRNYHLSPAVRAAGLLGGTVAEAAEYHRWIRAHDADHLTAAREFKAKRGIDWPLITVVLLGDSPETVLATLHSLRDQVYGEWQALCRELPPGMDDIDPRVRSLPAGEMEAIFSGFPDDALFTFVQAGDTLASTALLHLAEAARKHPRFSLIYSDEDRIDVATGLRARPFFKASWSPDLALAQNYTSRLALVRKERLGGSLPKSSAELYGAATHAAFSDQAAVVHVPFVLYHRAGANADDDTPAVEAVQKLLADSPDASGASALEQDGRVKVQWPVPSPPPRVSLIVPTRDRVDLLRVCVEGFLHETRYHNLEVIIADNDSQEEQTKTYLAKVSTHPRVRVVSCPGPFNFSAINNQAAAHAAGTLIGLMNNDLKVLDPDWLSEMVSHAVRPDIGIVGAKLLHGDHTIQHAGVTLGIGLASHIYKNFPASAPGKQGRLILPQDVSAVTAACLLMRRDVWDQVGGLDEEFPVAYNDVDLCLRVRSAGYRVLWTPDAVLYHLESQSRGKDVAPDKRERLEHDKARLLSRWGDQLKDDPFHSPNFSNRHVDCRLAFPPRVEAPWASKEAAQ